MMCRPTCSKFLQDISRSKCKSGREELNNGRLGKIGKGELETGRPGIIGREELETGRPEGIFLK